MTERPGNGELLAGVAGLVLLLTMFIFAWFGIEGFSGDAFEALDDWATIVLIFTSFAGMALALFGPDIPRADVAPLGAVTVTLGALSALIILIHIIAPPGVSAGPVSVDLDPEFGVWLGLIASIAVAVGGYQAIKEEESYVPPPAGQPQAPPPAQAPPPPPPPPAG